MAAADPSEKPMLQHALDYLTRGYPVFPVCSPLMGRHDHWDRALKKMMPCPPDKIGKNPMIRWKDCQDDLPSVAEVRSWWHRWPNANIGMATGQLSGVIVLDCDSGEARQAALAKGGLEKAPAVWTGTPGGIHFWMKHPGYPVKNFVKDIVGTDFRGDGGYVLLPPSRHHKGATYRWNEHTVDMEPVAVPEWLDALFRGRVSERVSDGVPHDALDIEEMLRGFKEGGRDNGLFKFACRLRHDDIAQPYAEELIRVSARNCTPAVSASEAVEKLRYVYEKYPAGNVGPSVDEDEWFSPPRPDTERVAASSFLRPVSEWLALPEVDPDWMVDQLFTVGSNGWVAAEPKVGKSWTVLELVYALSTGTPFLGRFAVKQPRRVIYIQEEDSQARVVRRLKQLLRGDSSRIPPSDEYLWCGVRSGFKIDNPSWIIRLRAELELFPAEVVVLDVFNRLHLKNENDQAEMSAILDVLTIMTRDYGCAFIVVHHNKKTQQGSEVRANQMMRGSSVLAGWSECALYLRKGKDKHVFIVTPESKDAPEMDDFAVTLRDTENGGIVLDIGGVSFQDRSSNLDNSIIAAVGRLTNDGVDATAQRIADAIGRERSGVQKRMKGIVESGELDEDEVQIGRTYVKIYTVATL